MSTTPITASLVMELRARTGAGMMECKKYLTMTEGDIEKAVTEMRKDGQAKADKKKDRIAAEGVITVARAADGKRAVMLEINSETDFVARDESFLEFSNKAAETALHTAAGDVEALAAHSVHAGEGTVEEARQHLVAKIGENIQLRRLHQLSSEGVVGCYLRGSRIGVMVALRGGEEALARDIAMHIAATRPLVVLREQVPAEAIENEREIFMAQARESGKPQDIINKMIEGRISKFVDEVSLVGQPFVKDPNKKIAQLLKEHNAEVLSFVCFVVGEGIEKKADNFVEEVMSQVRG